MEMLLELIDLSMILTKSSYGSIEGKSLRAINCIEFIIRCKLKH